MRTFSVQDLLLFHKNFHFCRDFLQRFKNANYFIDIPLKIDLQSIELELYFNFKISFSIDIFFLFFTQHSEPDYPEIKRRFPSSTITHIPGAGHWVHSEKPKEFLDIASKFINLSLIHI